MRKTEALAAVFIAILIGSVIIVALGGVGLPGQRSTSTDQALHTLTNPVSAATSTADLILTSPDPGTLLPTSTPAIILATPTPTGPQLQEGPPAQIDRDAVLLVYSPARATSFKGIFCALAGFYGLACKTLARDLIALTRADLLDAQGQLFKLIAIDASLLDPRTPGFLTESELNLFSSVAKEGSSLLISKLNDQVSGAKLMLLTGGAVSGITRPVDTVKDWSVSSGLPDLTRQFTGQNILTSQAASPDTFAITIENPLTGISIISSKSNTDVKYTIFTRIQAQGSRGAIFLDAGEDTRPPESIALREVYFSAATFSQIIPTMMVLRYTLGERTWHSNQDYANLTIDEVQLLEPYHDINFTALLELMKRDTFHTTVAVIPASWETPDPQVVALFLTNPTYFSLVQYGNNGKSHEFYRYAPPTGSTTENSLLTYLSLEQQEQNILEGLARLNLLYSRTRLLVEPIMVFPRGISPEKTLLLLKKYNYLATSNNVDVPLDSVRPADWDYGMYPSVNDYAGFPNLVRRAPGNTQAYSPALLSSLLDLFIGRPALFATLPFTGGVFTAGLDAFNETARELNRLPGGVEWRNLQYIAQHLYLERINDDGSRSVRMYTRQLILTNETETEQVIHILYPEPLDIPILRLTVNGYEFPYKIAEDILSLDLLLPPGTTAEISIEYR
jgi:hypothetical protein